MMSVTPRIIARMDIKSEYLIKGVHLEGLRKIGDPVYYAKKYYEQGADEIFYLDSVASLYGRSYVETLIKETAKDVFIPIAVGGGIKKVQDVERLLKSGADKIAINTAAIHRPNLIKEVSDLFGSQCMVLQIDIMKSQTGYEVFIDGGREKTGKCPIEWAKEAQGLGCGELLITSIDQDGTNKGLDYTLLEKITPHVHVPLVISGGFSFPDDISTKPNFEGVAIGSALHYNKCTVNDIKRKFKEINHA